MRSVRVAIILLAIALGPLAQAQTAPAQAPASRESAALAKKVESYYRTLFALGKEVRVNVSSPQPSPVPGLLQVGVTINDGRNSNREAAFLSPDGHYLVRGEVRDLTKDPYAAARAAINLDDQPARGPADAPVTIVEYSDFQCPYCREMYTLLETKIVKRHSEIRLVYKDFPIVQIHPWAMTAAIAGQCAYQQSNAAFWQLYTSIYENQREITTENIQTKLEGFATAAGLDMTRFKSCIASNDARDRLQAAFRETQTLGLDSTPTLFINGRRLVGSVPEQVLEKVIQFEMDQHAPPAKPVSPSKP